MKYKWLRLKTKVGTHEAGTLLEVDGTTITQEVARAYVTAGMAEDGGEGPERAIGDLVAADLANIRTGFSATMNGIVEDLRGVQERLNAPVPVQGQSEDEKVARGGQFKGIGHFALSVRAAQDKGADPADEMVKGVARYIESANKVTRAATGLSEGSDPDAGILVPADTANGIWDRVRDDEESPVNLAQTYTVSGNRLPLPAVDESSRANGARMGGIQAFWEGEAEQIGKSKPKFREMDLRLKKLAALVYLTDELMSDSRGLDSFLSLNVPKELRFKLVDAMFRGTGAGMPLGIFNSDCFLKVGKKSGQAATTLVTENLLAIYARTYGPSRRNARWYYNQDIEPQLGTLALPTGSSSGQLTFMPPGGVSGAPYSTIQGRPALDSEFAETLGTAGDIGLYDWSQYVMIFKGGVQTAVSIHLRFDFGETAYRWTVRADGQPAWNKPLTPFKGAATQSPFVAVETRA